jgi:glyoxylase I family protein
MANKKVKGMGFHHIALRVSDFLRSYDFYTKVLGFELVREWGEGDSHIAMLDIGDGGILELFAAGKKDAPSELYWHLAYKADDVDAAFAAAVAGGAAADKPPFDAEFKSRPAPGKARIAFVKGFDGEIIEFFCMK